MIESYQYIQFKFCNKYYKGNLFMARTFSNTNKYLLTQPNPNTRVTTKSVVRQVLICTPCANYWQYCVVHSTDLPRPRVTPDSRGHTQPSSWPREWYFIFLVVLWRKLLTFRFYKGENWHWKARFKYSLKCQWNIIYSFKFSSNFLDLGRQH